MKPVFKEELEFLDIPKKYIGYLWVNKRAYSGFDKDMNRVKFGRNVNKLPVDTSNLLTHEEFCKRYYDKYTSNKVKSEKIKLKEYLQNKKYEEYVVSVSGGKDSTISGIISMEVMDDLDIDYRILFGNTSNETHYTYRYVKETYGDKLEIVNPSEGFYQWCERINIIPTRFGRACCTVFKEGNISEYLDSSKKTIQLMGIRKDESPSRSQYERVRKGKWYNEAKDNWIMYLPILEFSDLDIWSMLIANNIKFNTLYRFGY